MSQSMKGKSSWFGKKHSEESKRKISETRKKMFQDKKNNKIHLVTI
jgi:hypothetical protein